jgi:tetratricopeptide (TPR) repeat protein
MWQSDGLIQIEVGSGIVRATTVVEKSSFLDSIFGKPSPQEGKILITYTQHLRDYLWQSEELSLPTINYRDNPSLQPNEIIIYFGLEVRRFTIKKIDEIFCFLIQKVREYNQIPCELNSVRHLLFNCLEYVRQGHYQYAFEIYQKVYYHSYLQSYEYELIQCLSAIGSLQLINGAIQDSALVFYQAFNLSNNFNIVDVNFKAQIALNTANVVVCLSPDLRESLQLYITAANLAYYSGNSAFFFLSLIGIGEVNYLLKDYDRAISIFEQTVELILVQPNANNYQIVFNLQQQINTILKQIINEQKSQQKGANLQFFQELFNQVKQTAISAMFNSLAGALVCKIFQVSHTSVISIFGHSHYKFNQPIFNAPTVIGKNNIQRLFK